MVLRGSSIVPPSLKEAEEAVLNAQKLLDKAKHELEEAKESSFEQLSDEHILNLSKEELISLVHKLKDRVDKFEQTEAAAQVKFEKTKQHLQKTTTSLACGGAAGAIARTFVAPVDRVKILMQVSHLKGTEAKYKTVTGTFRQIVKDEGWRSLWRGNLTNCIRVIPHTSVQFSTYPFFKGMFVDDGEKVTIPVRLLSGAMAGMSAATVTHPMDCIRIRLQTQPELKGIMDASRSMFAENGIRTFYKGYVPAMLSLSPFIAVNFATFDTLKSWYFGTEKKSKKELQERNPAIILGLGAVAGLCAQTVCYPLDTVRRRMQVSGNTYSSTLNAFSTIFRDEGPRGFYKGMTANALKVVPNNSIRFFAFEILTSYFASDDSSTNQTSWKPRPKPTKSTL
mmetsp:Transcript_12196/g.19829  ORF Transcript_12196/g.19829 Transcript_12196/m.19829 type:complete len:395 (-) Transcript_12196:708-1892(-)|eukprot:CAMPEP_0203749736 /NCGR_PEP_ID=MMETSP0098-20131031/4176_1 /ASSEMBLY_ACC=CAM_ASM_000208 /TAXON_ID=96639 /ORGANISM=" , Strain NY0313808BC1" /LENGTH=394 /DNA_ID=CAMNT_0050638831 /DNA_START=35 /DNA_END=1219 /DNA_ORIENTATION=+